MGPPRWAWLSAAEALVDAMWPFQRRDHRATVLTLVGAMVWAADPETMLTKPTVARLMAATGRSERSVQRWLRKIEASPLVEVTEPGSTARYRPGILRRSQGRNLAREWRLILPGAGQPSDIGVTRGHPISAVFSGDQGALDLDRNAPTRARDRAPRHLRRRRQREGQRQNVRRCAPGSLSRPSVVPAAPPWPLGRNPRRRPERLGAAEALRGAHPVLSRMSARELRSICRPWFAAEWTPQDVIWHAEHDLDGSPLGYGHAVILPARWLRWRLARWLGPDGTPLPPRSRQLADAAERARQLQAQRRAEHELLAAAAADPRPHFEEIRAARGWQREPNGGSRP